MKFKNILTNDNINIDYSEQMENIMVIHLDSNIRMRLDLDDIKRLEGTYGEVIGEPYMCDPGEEYVYVLDEDDVIEILETCEENMPEEESSVEDDPYMYQLNLYEEKCSLWYYSLVSPEQKQDLITNKKWIAYYDNGDYASKATGIHRRFREANFKPVTPEEYDVLVKFNVSGMTNGIFDFIDI